MLKASPQSHQNDQSRIERATRVEGREREWSQNQFRIVKIFTQITFVSDSFSPASICGFYDVNE